MTGFAHRLLNKNPVLGDEVCAAKNTVPTWVFSLGIGLFGARSMLSWSPMLAR